MAAPWRCRGWKTVATRRNGGMGQVGGKREYLADPQPLFFHGSCLVHLPLKNTWSAAVQEGSNQGKSTDLCLTDAFSRTSGHQKQGAYF
jgi:hypothetical protein